MTNKVNRKTPIGTFRWFKMLEAHPGFDDDNDLYFSTQLLLPAEDPATFEFLAMIDDIAEDMIGAGKRSANALPYKEDDDEANEERMIQVRFKCKQLERRDGTMAPGPLVVDSKKNPWPLDLKVGNGSRGVIAFKPFKWSSKSGSGISLIPTAAMVIEHVPMPDSTGLDMLDECEGFVVDEALAVL